tara:strand:- start:149 stop:427 length:279 start_codon:yes stop_codon:yes gene_type:complete
MILKLSLLNLSLLIFFFIFTKVLLSSYRKKPLKYMHLQIQYFGVKLLFSSFLVMVFCIKNQDLVLSGILSSLTVFVIYHIIEGFIFQKILET